MATSDSPLSVAASRGLSLALGQAPQAQGVIFQENFDAQPDWTSTMHSLDQRQDIFLGDTIPTDWTGVYQTTEWSPEKGFPTKHASVEILDANTDKNVEGSTKSAVMWRESGSNSSGWNSDGDLIKILDQQYTELFFQFKIRFSPNWEGRYALGKWSSKMMRLFYWDGVGDMYSGIAGNALGPMLLWNYQQNEFGVRNFLSFRYGEAGSAYYPPNPYRGWSRNYTDMLQGQGPGGADSTLVDALDGTPLVQKTGQIITHEQVFGPETQTTTIAFYVKMNSAPGVADGEVRQWMNGHRIFTANFGFIDAGNMVGWNGIGIGGNDFFSPYPPEQQFEDWYSIGMVEVHDSIPDGLE